ncbi:FecR family protein [Azospirillum sp. ST 5-10]|uniref:FecR family protein n=1 Tax=unclassified Azospirillum TaxID=2630922 RepID=UPI003F4A60B0
MRPDPQPSDEQKDAAALWLAKRAGGSMSGDDEARLQAWLAADRGNRQAFDQMRVVWAQLGEPAQRLAGRPALLPRTVRAIRRSWLGAAAAVAVAVAVLFVIDPGVVQDWRADIVSDRRIVTVTTLPDGSLLHLGADTALATDFADGHRSVALLRGQAVFDVRHRDGDAFVVTAGDARVQVVGTRFGVDLLPDRTVVSVAEGTVRVRTATDEGILLQVGEQAEVAAGTVRRSAPASVAPALAWTAGRLSVRGITLADLAAVLERHVAGRILVLGAAAERRVSGTFPLTDPKGSLETAAAAAGSTVVALSPWLTLVH